MKDIKLHKELNRQPLKFERELNLKMYKEIVYKINKSNSLEVEYEFTKQELRTLLGIKNKHELLEFQRYFHSESIDRKQVFILDEKFSIGGGVFSSKIDVENGSIGFMINPYWKNYFYSRIDIDQWHEVKGDTKKIKALNCSTEDKTKLTNLMTSVINHSVKGKYSQRLLDLLSQFTNTGLFVMGWQDWRRVMEIPKVYKASNIDQQILNKAKIELLKADIKINKIVKQKKGRSIDKIYIYFSKTSPNKPLQIMDSYNEKLKELTGSVRSSLEDEKIKLHAMLGKSGRFDLMSELDKVNNIETLNEFRVKHEISQRGNKMEW